MPAALKIYRPENDAPTNTQRPGNVTWAAGPGLTRPPAWPGEPATIGAAWTLDQLFARYFEPAGLAMTGARPETCRAYRDALAYWRKLTGNPPLATITPLTVANFARDLANAEPLRRPAAGRTPGRLAVTTQHRILRTLRALLRSAGTDSRHGPALAAIPAAPFVPLPRLRPTPAEAPSFEALARLFASASPRWRATLATLFYTGLRPGAAFALTGADLDLTAGRWTVRPETNTKTGKAYDGPMHPAALRALRELHPAGIDPTTRLLAWPHGPATVRAEFYRLQKAAAVTRFRLRDIRRSHAAAIAAAGITAATKAAQLALQHHDQRTTAGHYLAVAPLLLALPNLYPPEAPPNGPT